MYCWSCGKQTSENLNYCSSCGARVDKTAATSGDMSWMSNPSTALSYLGIFGLGGFIFLVVVLLKRSIDLGFVFAISLLYLSALFGICFLLIRQVSNHSDERKVKKNLREEAPTQFRPGITAQLEEPREPFITVTENTTKTLDEVLIERKF